MTSDPAIDTQLPAHSACLNSIINTVTELLRTEPINFLRQGRNQGGGVKGGQLTPPKCLEGPALAMGLALAAGSALTSTMLF